MPCWVPIYLFFSSGAAFCLSPLAVRKVNMPLLTGAAGTYSDETVAINTEYCSASFSVCNSTPRPPLANKV